MNSVARFSDAIIKFDLCGIFALNKPLYWISCSFHACQFDGEDLDALVVCCVELVIVVNQIFVRFIQEVSLDKSLA